MLLLIAFVMFAVLLISWVLMPDKPAIVATAAKSDAAVDAGVMPARA